MCIFIYLYTKDFLKNKERCIVFSSIIIIYYKKIYCLYKASLYVEYASMQINKKIRFICKTLNFSY